MDFMESLRALRRRWILTSVLLLLTLAASAAAVVKLPWTYQSQAMTVLLASKNAAKSAGNNPYLAFDQSLTLTADVVRREVMDPRTALALHAQGYPALYQVAAASDTSGPVLLITVTGGNKTVVEHTLYGVTAEVDAKLATLQAGIAPHDQIRSLLVSLTPQATLSAGKKARPLVVVFGLGLALTFAIPQVVDAQVTRRRTRKRRAPGRPGDGYPSAQPADGRRRQPVPRAPAPIGDMGAAAARPPGGRRALDPDDPEPASRWRARR